ncbi:ABC transporter permease [Aeromonas veronii]|uniref:ABC transporter permease n=2 Tax=Aeromonas veronii TaxID=654 RepID=UPI0011166F17|nr:ABC transporter permease [Aeromonas veronii]TNI08373.1 macrolide ABC transporter permease/ATP-binding protein MacB [Aeromonas veronii]HDO1313435.1 ABC transporter permease [Aeromonas veronii]
MSPLILCEGITRSYMSGGQAITVLHPLDLTIMAGEMVAIMGPSGSGKSTLLNVLGCLDRPTAGRYLFRGQDTGQLDALALARLRCHHIGFIFQRYHLLPHLDAVANVEIPAIYAGRQGAERREQASMLLARLGLQALGHHQPGQLSGGQQQRVSIARALINGADVILADEPTGALDSQSGQGVLAILKELHLLGHTVVLVTHDPAVAACAERVIELHDGRVVQTRQLSVRASPQALPAQVMPSGRGLAWARWREACVMAARAMMAHRMRTFLTMLGIIIGIAAVVSVVALGQGARSKVLNDINALGTNTIDIFTGRHWGDENAAAIRTLNERDLVALSSQPYLSGASPELVSPTVVRWRNKGVGASLVGVSPAFFAVKGMVLQQGRLLNEMDLHNQAAVAVIDEKAMKSVFGDDAALGQVVLAGDLPIQIVGVVKDKNPSGNPQISLWIPYRTLTTRLQTQDHFTLITVRLAPGVDAETAEQGITTLLSQRHGTQDFVTYNNDSVLKSVDKTATTLTLLVSSIAVISLIVGGVGVMNIMLVSVVERTREIGIRVAVGARRSDILQQFLIEAVLVTQLGGVLGAGVSLLIGVVFEQLVQSMQMEFSLLSLLAAFGCSSLIGILFGFLPARKAANLNPVEALTRE